jgi:DNA-binding CsgD family transcriptional regulator
VAVWGTDRALSVYELVLTQDLDHRGWLLSLGVRTQYRLTDGVRKNFARLGIHVLAALRLKARLATMAKGESPNGDAVLSPAGKVLNAEGDARLAPARHALREAVARIEAARSSARADSHKGLELWRGLAAEKWSLVDQFERDGSCYVVARSNPPTTKTLAALSERERAVVAYGARGLTTKEIAYGLGISDATVRVLFMRAGRKCGFKTRRELVTFWSQMPGAR